MGFGTSRNGAFKLPRNLGKHSYKEHVVPKKQEVLYKVIISGKLYIYDGI